MVNEGFPTAKKAEDAVRPEKESWGSGLEEIGRGFRPKAGAIRRSLQERRPVILITDAAERSLDPAQLIKDLLVDELDLQPEESEFVASTYLDEFDKELVDKVIEDKSRPILIPVALGPHERVDWWIGPIWMLYTKVNYQAFLENFRQIPER